jgi:hypothetical protein
MLNRKYSLYLNSISKLFREQAPLVSCVGWLDCLLKNYMERVEAGPQGGVMWQCGVCQKTYPHSRSSNLKDHIEANHLGDLALPCDRCDKTFSTRASLRMHVKKKHV